MAVEAASVAASTHQWRHQWQYNQQQHLYPQQSDHQLLIPRSSSSSSSSSPPPSMSSDSMSSSSSDPSSNPSSNPSSTPSSNPSESNSSSGKLVFDPAFLKLAASIPPAFIWPEGHHHHPPPANYSSVGATSRSGVESGGSSLVTTALGALSLGADQGKESKEEEEEEEEEESEGGNEEEEVVPTIDLSKWRSNDWGSMREIAEQAYEAGAGIGFFQIVNHGVPEELTRRVHESSRRFFELPAARKQRAERRVGESFGYASSFTARFSSRLPWKETFSLQPSPESNISGLFRRVYDDCGDDDDDDDDCGGDDDDDCGDDDCGDGDCVAIGSTCGHHRCQHRRCRGAAAALERYSDAMIALGLEVLDVLGAGLRLGLMREKSSSVTPSNSSSNTSGSACEEESDESEEESDETDEFVEEESDESDDSDESEEGEESDREASTRRRIRVDCIRASIVPLRRYFEPDHSSILRLNNYPTCQQPWLTFGTGPHTDPTGLTLLHQDHVAGLQVFHRRRWHTVAPRADAFVVNIGDTLMALTNGRFKSCLHRALVNQHEDRRSVAFFFNPGFHVPLSPPPELVDDTHPRAFRDFTWAHFLYFTQSIHRSSINTLHAFNQWLATGSS